jgi:hypothetical protein
MGWCAGAPLMQRLDKLVMPRRGSTTGGIEQKPLVKSVLGLDTRMSPAESCPNNIGVFTYLARM